MHGAQMDGQVAGAANISFWMRPATAPRRPTRHSGSQHMMGNCLLERHVTMRKLTISALGIVATLGLSGCGPSPDVKTAIDLCEAAVKERLTDPAASFDRADMAKNAEILSDGIKIDSFFSGTKAEGGRMEEYQQRFSCTAALVDASGNPNPRVIRIQILW